MARRETVEEVAQRGDFHFRRTQFQEDVSALESSALPLNYPGPSGSALGGSGN